MHLNAARKKKEINRIQFGMVVTEDVLLRGSEGRVGGLLTQCSSHRFGNGVF